MIPQPDMPGVTSSHGWWAGIVRRARERDTERVLRYDRTRQAGAQVLRATLARAQMPPLLPEYLKALLGSAIGFWLLAWPLDAFADVSRVLTYAVLGLVFSLQATHHKYRLARDPEYRIRKCNCAGTRQDGTETVLKSRASAIAGVPLSLFGVMIYAALLTLLYLGRAGAALVVATSGLVVSAYLAFVMIMRIRALCSTCMNIAALNILLLLHLLR